MRKLLTIAVLFTMFSCTRAQNDAGIRYNREIWKAEMAICHGKYDSAFVYYDNAFRIHPGWGTDYYNVALLAIMQEKSDMLYTCLDSLASKGYSSDDIQEFVPKKYANGDRWNALCAKIANYNRQFEQRYAKVKAQLDSMVVLDQKYAGNLPNDSITLVYHKIVYQNGINIINLIKSGCIPADNLYDINKYNASQIPYILVHHYLGLCHQLQLKGNLFTSEQYKSMDFSKNNLDEVMLCAVQQGLMTPYCLVKGQCAWTTEQNPFTDSQIHIYGGVAFTKQLTAEQEKTANINREKLGLGILAENRERAVFDDTRVSNVGEHQFMFYTGTQVYRFIFKNDQEPKVKQEIESNHKALLNQGWVRIN